MSDWTRVGPVEGRPDLDCVLIEGREIAIARLGEGSWVAFDNSCPHEECPLSEGDLEADRIICFCHSATFDLRTGAVLEGPAEEPLSMYPVRIAGGELEVAVQ